jgi:hypothetical protein
LENQKRRDYLEGLGIGKRIILNSTLKKQGGRVWTGFIWLTMRTIGRLK